MEAGEGAPPEPKDFQIGCSWLPSIPVKPASTTQLPICECLQANDPYQPNCIESGIYNPFNPIPQLTNFVYEESLSSFYAWKTSKSAKSCVIGDVIHTPNKYPMRGDSSLSCMSFQTLLALADTYGSQVAMENVLKDRDCVGTRQPSKSCVIGDVFHTPNKYPMREASSLSGMSFQTLLALADAGGSQVAMENVLKDRDCVGTSQPSNSCVIGDVLHTPNKYPTNSVYEKSLSSFDAWQASQPSKSCVIGDVFHTPNEYPTREASSLSSMSFQTLLPLADVGGSQVALENVLKDRDCVGTSICPFDPHFNFSSL